MKCPKINIDSKSSNPFFEDSTDRQERYSVCLVLSSSWCILQGILISPGKKLLPQVVPIIEI